MEITIPETDGKERRRCQEGRAQEKDLTHPRGKRPVKEKQKKKKKGKGPAVGTLTTTSNTRIPILLTEEEEER